MNDLKPNKVVSPTLRITSLVSISVFVATLVLAFVLQTEIVARGEGRIVPIGRVQVIQSEHPGKVSKLFVENGDFVEKGDTLLVLDTTDDEIQKKMLTSEYDKIEQDILRTINYINQVDIIDKRADKKNLVDSANTTFSDSHNPVLVSARSDTFELADKVLEVRVAELNSVLAVIDSDEQSSQIEIDIAIGELESMELMLTLKRQDIALAKSLYESDAGNRMSLTTAENELRILQREHHVQKLKLKSALAKKESHQIRKQEVMASAKSSAHDSLTDLNNTLLQNSTQNQLLYQSIKSSRITAPVSGVVDRLELHAIGGVVDSGEVLFTIVPYDQGVELEVTFSNRDAGFLQQGQLAKIRLEAYPAERFGAINGVVSGISADSIEKDGMWGYLARIEPEDWSLDVGNEVYHMRPGMTGTVDVIIGKRRLIEYFFAPIAQALSTGMKEL